MGTFVASTQATSSPLIGYYGFKKRRNTMLTLGFKMLLAKATKSH
jgi:hypothetical protein